MVSDRYFTLKSDWFTVFLFPSTYFFIYKKSVVKFFGTFGLQICWFWIDFNLSYTSENFILEFLSRKYI